MQKTKEYNHVRFSADVLQEASRVFREQVDPKNEQSSEYYLSVKVDDAEWHHDSLEEFLADYRRTSRSATYSERLGFGSSLLMRVYSFRQNDHPTAITTVEVEGTSRSKVEAAFEVFERQVEASRMSEVPSPPSSLRELPKIFIGHGNNNIWKDLKDHLHEQHNFDVIAYEIGARAGHEIRDILEDMLESSSFAILVMTGEDSTKDDLLHPRLNVVHELGLFQGRLGFSRSIALLEEGTQEFSNINGVHQIRFSKGNIRETYGDVLATLKREFPETSDLQMGRETEGG